ncbi:pentapeptide repeat-containing protein [Sphingobacterium paramultivorum]|uniref:pentapeptide repeat-containing protein n=1 Tax=Sphingobacterium paramultivorum TaxID=2886510 RepID=UPI00129C81AC|nr:pentapeptide repeat-containing protein [Sphingobacterium paramultivorum]
MKIVSRKKIEQNIIDNLDCVNVEFKNCTFINCEIKDKKISNSRFTNCNFISCIFQNCSFFFSVLQKSGIINDCIFKENDFSKAIVGELKIEKTSFLNNKFKETSFDGTEFENVLFEGNISSSWFYGVPYADQLYSKNIFFSKKMKDLKMPIIDFKNAILDDVTFSRGLNLSHVVFPKQDNLLIISNPQHFFDSFLSKSRIAFQDNDSFHFCQNMVDKVWFNKDVQNMPIVLVDLSIFNPSLNEIRDNKIIELLKSTIEN